MRRHREDGVSRSTSTRSPPTFVFVQPPTTTTPAKQKKEEEEDDDDDDDDDDAVSDNTRGYRFSR